MKRAFAPVGLVLLAAGLCSTVACVDQDGAAPGADSGTFVLEAGALDSGITAVSISLGANAVLDFGPVDCGGTAPASKTFTVQNTGSTEVHYSLSLSATSVFQITGDTSGQIAPGTSASVTIAANAVPTSATAGQLDQATLTLTTDDPALPTTSVTLKRTAQGATFTVSPATVAFGDVPLTATSATNAITLTNTGNAPATVAVGAPTDSQFALSGASAPATIAAQGSFPSLGATFAPTASGPASASSALTVTGAVCGASVASIAFSGDGTKGVDAVAPGTLDFQKVSCGTTAKAQSVTVTNGGNASFHYTATLLGGATSPFTLAAGASGVDGGAPATDGGAAKTDAGASDGGVSDTSLTGTLAPGAVATISVVPNKIPSVASTTANAFGDTLRITSDAVGDANHDVTLTQTAQGAVLGLATTTIPFNNVILDQTATAPFSITNSGNLAANLTFKVTGAAFGATPTGANALAAGAAPLAGTATFKPTGLGGQGGSIAIQTGATDVLCSAPIGPIALSGTGVNGVMAVSTGTLDFLSVPCGQAGAKQTFTINNTGTAAFTWAATLGLGTSSHYTVSPASGTQNPGAAATTVTVTPTAIPGTSALTANLYGDTLTITPTGIEGGTAQTVALKETAEGAVITATPTALPAFANQQEQQASGAATFTLTNTGTMAATITPSISGTNPTSFSLATPGAKALALGGGAYSPGPTFTPQATGALTAQLGLAKGATDVICQPLPGPFTLSGTGVNGAITLAATSLTFTNQSCGATTGQTQTLKLTNNGSGPLTFNAAVLGTSGFAVAPATGSLAAGGASTLLTITSPTFTTTQGNVTAVTDTLRVTTNAYGDTNHDVTLSSKPFGALLAWSPTPSLAFGTVQATTHGTVSKGLPAEVINNGTAPATVGFTVAGATTVTVAPQNVAVAALGGTLNSTATYTPTATGALTGTVTPTVPNGTVLCGSLPVAANLSGTGAVGTFNGAPTGMGFQLTCNAAPVPQTFTLSNVSGLVPYDFTLAYSGTGWTATPPSGTVDPGLTVTVTVTPPAVGEVTPATANDANVTITTDIPGDFVHGVPVDGTVSGAAFPANPFTAAGVPQPTYNYDTPPPFYLPNSGNASVTVDWIVVPDAANVSPDLLIVDFVDTTIPAGGQGQFTYELPNYPESIRSTYGYTVYFPAANGDSGVCSAQSTQYVTVDVDTT